MRNAAELSTTTVPFDAAIGAHSLLTSSGTSNTATSIPMNDSGVISSTVNSLPRTFSFLPALLLDANNLI